MRSHEAYDLCNLRTCHTQGRTDTVLWPSASPLTWLTQLARTSLLHQTVNENLLIKIRAICAFQRWTDQQILYELFKFSRILHLFTDGDKSEWAACNFTFSNTFLLRPQGGGAMGLSMNSHFILCCLTKLLNQCQDCRHCRSGSKTITTNFGFTKELQNNLYSATGCVKDT